ncbi:MAG: beta-galactosidase [Victivallaceae bacterium]|jgi:hypothetical protein
MRFLLQLCSICLIAAFSAQAEVKIRGEKFANWWVLGETVGFKPDGRLPENIKNVIGEIYDSSGKKVSERTVSATDFAASGWQWKPEQPGFYEVKFQYSDAADALTPAQETINCKIYEWVKGKPHLQLENNFVRQCHNIAVLPRPTRPPEQIPPQLAVSLGPAYDSKPKNIQWANDNLKLAAMTGFHAIRIHTIPWDRIETEQGKYDWNTIDLFIAEARKRGFSEFIGDPVGTPKWASTHPELINLDICVWEYAAYAPVKISYWTDFLKVLVNRYPFIRTWELWNEPHLPGQSVFWRDSPEKFVELLKAGYDTVKQERPDTTVWIGGMGMRYLPFYEEIMKLGAGKYFDRLVLHGSWVSPAPFQRIDRSCGVEPKPWVSSEWHAMLASGDEAVTPAEEALSNRMLVDFMNHIRQGAEMVTFFTMTNIQHAREHEMMDYFRKNKQFFQTFGLFRATPYIEPRRLAVVWRNFTDCFAGKIRYIDGYYFDGGKQRAALMQSDSGKVLFFWSNTDKPLKPVAELAAAAAGANPRLTDWEGRTCNVAGLEIQPAVVYFLKNPDEKTIAQWTSNRGQVLTQIQKEPELDRTVNGRYRAGRIFDTQMNATDTVSLPWLPADKYVAMNQEKPQEGLAARFAAALDSSGMDLLVEVNDRIHHQIWTDGNIYQGDSVQLALDAAGKGLAEDRLEISAALTPKGPLLWKEAMPPLGGDLPSRITFARKPLQYGKIAVEKTATGLCYKIHVDRDDLYPFSYISGQPVRFSLLINNNDGGSRAGYLEWASGIGNAKDPAQYGTLTVDIGKQILFKQDDLRGFWGAAKLESGKDSVKVICSGVAPKTASAIATREIEVTPGAAYQISFEARGNVKQFNGMLNMPKTGRKDFLSRAVLGSEWKHYGAVVVIPNDVRKLSVSLFCWQQDGWFEIKGFSMAAAQ